MMKLKFDSNFCDLLRAFHSHGVKYLIIGGWAVSIHAQPRATKDLDIFVSADPVNVETVYQALAQFGAPLENMDKNQFLKPGTFFRIGAPPCQIEVFPEVPGIDFEVCWPHRVEVLLDTEDALFVNFISAEDLIAAKIATAREQDIADVQAIRRARQQKGRV
jgi:predicted nucleotidyltransferase